MDHSPDQPKKMNKENALKKADTSILLASLATGRRFSLFTPPFFNPFGLKSQRLAFL
jgi:hypothetical protein